MPLGEWRKSSFVPLWTLQESVRVPLLLRRSWLSYSVVFFVLPTSGHVTAHHFRCKFSLHSSIWETLGIMPAVKQYLTVWAVGPHLYGPTSEVVCYTTKSSKHLSSTSVMNTVHFFLSPNIDIVPLHINQYLIQIYYYVIFYLCKTKCDTL